MSPYNSLMPNDRPTPLGNLLQPMAEGFASGLDEDRIRRRNISDRVDAYKSLMPYQMDTFKQQHEILGQMQDKRDAAALYKALRLKEYELNGPKPTAQRELSDMFTNRKTAQIPWEQTLETPTPNTPNYSASEEAASGMAPTGSRTKVLPIDRSRASGLAVQAGIRGKDLESLLASAEGGPQGPAPVKAADIFMDRDQVTGKVQRVNKVTGEVLDTPDALNAPRPPSEYTLPDGSRWTVDHQGKRSQVSPPIKTAQPLTAELSAARYAGVKPGEEPTPEQAAKMNEYHGLRSGERAGETEAAKIKRREELKDLVAAVAGAVSGAQQKAGYDVKLDRPITPAEATLYRLPAGTTRREMLAMNPKPITESDIDAGTQFSAAKAMLKEYRDISTRLLTATDAVGAMGQRAKLEYGYFTRTDEDAVRLRALQATVPLLVRALGEKGTLATQDVQRALNAVPDFGDTQQSAQAKIVQLEKFIGTVEANIKQLRPGLERQTGSVLPSSSQPKTATGPNGEKLILKDGQWVPYGR